MNRLVEEKPQELLKFIGLEGYTFKNKIDTKENLSEVLLNNGTYLLLTEENCIIHIEFKSSNRNFETDLNNILFRSAIYGYKYNRGIITVIIYDNSIKKRECKIISKTLSFSLKTIFISELQTNKKFIEILNNN